MNAVSSSSECDQGTLFSREIHNMMHAFGDSSAPLNASVKLVESVLCKQLHCLVMRASEITTMRGAKEMGIEDILFLMRKDRTKIHRLLNYLGSVGSSQRSLRRMGLGEWRLPPRREPPNSRHLTPPNCVKDFHSNLTKQLGNTLGDPSGASVVQKEGKRRRMCLDFLETIDQTGELTDKQQPFDTVKHERNLRAELMAQNMDENRYLEYTNARRTSFTYRYGQVNKIQNWLQSCGMFPELPKVNPLLYQILAYLAYETVAQIVDLSFLVRQDGAAKPGDAFSYYVAGFTRMPGNPSQHTTEPGAKKVGGAPPITPAEIREALRRYWSPQLSPWSPFTRSLPSSLHSKLLMC